jgi:hypothetical protein
MCRFILISETAKRNVFECDDLWIGHMFSFETLEVCDTPVEYLLDSLTAFSFARRVCHRGKQRNEFAVREKKLQICFPIPPMKTTNCWSS